MNLLLPLPILLLLLISTTTTTITPPSGDCKANINVYNSTSTAKTGITELGMKLLKELEGPGNILISPYSIWSVLAMVLVGAEGKTEADLVRVLGLRGKKGSLALWKKLDQSLLNSVAGDSKVSLDLANRIYVNQGFSLQSCQTELTDLLVSLDMAQAVQASKTINNFVNTSTNGLISEIITPNQLGPNTLMVLLNAVYFKGTWRYPFPKQNTKQRPFHVTPNAEPVLVDFMYEEKMEVLLGYFPALKLEVLQLPYSSGLVSMSILLPREEGEASFSATLRALNSTSLWDALSSPIDTTLSVLIPKFEIKSTFANELKVALQTLGISDLFGPTANLSSFSNGLYVQHMVHKTVVKVDEEGAEAAAVSGVFVALSGGYLYTVDRPFIFCIHTKDTILFIGTYKKP